MLGKSELTRELLLCLCCTLLCVPLSLITIPHYQWAGPVVAVCEIERAIASIVLCEDFVLRKCILAAKECA